MKIRIELTDSMLRAIAQVQAEKDSYDKLSDCDNDLTEMYSVAFYDGMRYLLDIIERNPDSNT